MDLAFFRDVEQGIPEEGEMPLLPQPSRPLRTTQLNMGDQARNPLHPAIPKLIMPEQTPSSSSTQNNTPTTGTPDAFPKKWRRSDRRQRRLNTELLEAIENEDLEEAERLLKAGANPNTTCRLDLYSACHIAAMTPGDALSLLLRHGAEKHRLDRRGRTPLHLAAWTGNARQMAILLDLPEDIQNRLNEDSLSSEAEEDVRKVCQKTREMANLRCDLGEVKTLVPNSWKDNIDHDCKKLETYDLLQPGWTPLHVASASARKVCTRLLLAAGADPNICDIKGRTALDVVGSGYYFEEEIEKENFVEEVQMLLKAGCEFHTMNPKGLKDLDTPLHIAVELESIEGIQVLLNAGASIDCRNSAGLTPLHLCVNKQYEEPLQVLANYGQTENPLTAMVDVKDKGGHTVLQAAIDAAWVPGVCVALEAGANVTVKANDGETPVHSAATLGNIDVLNEIFSVAKQKDFIDIPNDAGETALFKAIIHGHFECVEAILDEGASLKTTLPGDVNVLHVAAEQGHCKILEQLIKYDDEATNEMLNVLTTADKRGFGPIHFAVSNNHADCVQILISKNADIRLRTTDSPHKASTPLHIAAVKNYTDIAKLILNYDKTTIHEVNGMGWWPLHSAAHHGSRDVIMLLLNQGADLSTYTDGPKKYRRRAIDMIINNLSKPTDFLEEVFDSYISTNTHNLQDQSCEIIVDYRILRPACLSDMEQMKVIEALLKTGNRYDQSRLLVHPLVESFLYLKWKALLPFFYTILAMYALFLMSVTTFIVSVFFYKDTLETIPAWLSPRIWGYIVYITTGMVLLQELLYMNIKSSRYFLQLETWVKFGSIGIALVLPASVLISPPDAQWPRHVATTAVLLSWLEMMFLLSRFPNWGYYVLMFGKVAMNVIKILATFAFLVIGFSLSFMIQFHSQIPFDGPWAAFVKTLVMMTSEFDYSALFDADHTESLATSIIIVRLIFVLFLILAAIVLMNLMVGVAVNDINDLEVLGNIKRLEKQVEFLTTLDTIVYNRVVSKILPNRVNDSVKTKRKVQCQLTLCPGKPRWKFNKILPSRLRDNILNKAQTQKKQLEDEIDFKIFKSKINDMHEAIVSKNKKEEENSKMLKVEAEKHAKFKCKLDEIVKHLNDLDSNIVEVKNKMEENDKEKKSPVEALNVKVDQISIEMEEIKQFLSRLESKLGGIGER